MANLNMTHSAIAKKARADRAAVIRPAANTVPANIATEAALQLYAKFQIRDDNAPPTYPHVAPTALRQSILTRLRTTLHHARRPRTTRRLTIVRRLRRTPRLTIPRCRE
jgi:hypothetical protein